MKDRIAQILLEEGLTASKFAEIVGVQPSGISHIISGRNKPGYDLIIKILIHFPHIDPDWLLLDKGSMYREGAERPVRSSLEPTLFDSRRTIKAMQTQAAATTQSENGKLQASYNFDQSVRDTTIGGDAGNIEGGLTGFTFEGQRKITGQATLARVSGTLGIKTAENAEIERVMIFYSDNTVDTYKLKK